MRVKSSKIEHTKIGKDEKEKIKNEEEEKKEKEEVKEEEKEEKKKKKRKKEKEEKEKKKEEKKRKKKEEEEKEEKKEEMKEKKREKVKKVKSEKEKNIISTINGPFVFWDIFFSEKQAGCLTDSRYDRIFGVNGYLCRFCKKGFCEYVDRCEEIRQCTECFEFHHQGCFKQCPSCGNIDEDNDGEKDCLDENAQDSKPKEKDVLVVADEDEDLFETEVVEIVISSSELKAYEQNPIDFDFVESHIVVNDEFIAKVFNKSLSQRVSIVKRFNIVLTRGLFVKSLSYGSWMNDEIISFYLGGLMVNFQQSGVFICSPFFLECLLRPKFSFDNVKNWFKDVAFFNKYNKIIILCHINGNHWCLFVVSLEEKTFFCYDSLQNNLSFLRVSFSRWLLCLHRHFRRILQKTNWQAFGLQNDSFGKDVSKWEYIHSPESFKQPNGFDCGPLMLLAMDYEARSKTEHFGFQLPGNNYKEFSARLRNDIAKNLLISGSSLNFQTTPLINSIQ